MLSIEEIVKKPLREQQTYVLGNLDYSKKVNLVTCPTGVGKSFLAYHLAHRFGGAQIITPNTLLQDQYLKDVNIPNLKGKRHYSCGRYGTTSDLCEDMLEDELAFADEDTKKSIQSHHDANCNYRKACNKFKNGKYGITGVEITYFGIHNDSNVLIIDEAHNIIEKLLNLSGVTIHEKMQKYGDCFAKPLDQFAKNKNLKEFLHNCKCLAKLKYGELNASKSDKNGKALLFLDTLVELDHTECSYEWDKKNYRLCVKRLSLEKQFRHLLVKEWGQFGPVYYDQVFMLSATVPNPNILRSILGIPESHFNSFSVDSPFPEENINVYQYGGISLTNKTYDTSIDRACRALKDILDREPGRGIVHVTSFKQLNDIRTRLGSTRFIWAESGMNVTAMLSQSKDGVLVSPSSYEGLDLKGELGTFSVTFKKPWAYLTEWSKKMDEKFKGYYFSLCVSRFIQGMGRVIRTNEDKANLYHIDRCGDLMDLDAIPSNIYNAERKRLAVPILQTTK